MQPSPVNELEHRRGRLQAPIQLIEYADFECPYCGMAFYEIEKLLATEGENICFIFRHFPISRIHQHALMAAVASEAAGDQDKFWEMHELLFQNQENLNLDTIVYFAEVLGLDMETFEQALLDEKHNSRVEMARNVAQGIGISETPTIFINGRKFDRPATYDNLVVAVQELLYGGREPVVNS